MDEHAASARRPTGRCPARSTVSIDVTGGGHPGARSEAKTSRGASEEPQFLTVPASDAQARRRRFISSENASHSDRDLRR